MLPSSIPHWARPPGRTILPIGEMENLIAKGGQPAPRGAGLLTMTSVDLTALNEQFALEDHLSFQEGPGGLPVAAIKNNYATATVVLQGAHVLAYRPLDGRPVLWTSGSSRFEPGHPGRNPRLLALVCRPSYRPE